MGGGGPKHLWEGCTRRNQWEKCGTTLHVVAVKIRYLCLQRSVLRGREGGHGGKKLRSDGGGGGREGTKGVVD